MTSLLARLLTSTVRADVPPNAPSSKSSEQAESTRKSYKKHASNARARKSITSLFGFAAKIPAVEDGHGSVLVHSIATCQEAQHYPTYDPNNPEHEPRAVSIENPPNPASVKRRPSRSPTKVPRWKRSPSLKRTPASSKTRTRLQGLADTLRAKASIFYEVEQQSSEEELIPHETLVPPTPGSGKSVSSKKSVRFRSGHSVIGNVLPQSSPIAIPTKSPPSLSLINFSSTPMFEETSDEEMNHGQTARPLDKLPTHIPFDRSPEKNNRLSLSLELQDNIGIVPAIPTPLPGTNIPLEDPFDDAAAAAALRSGHAANGILTRATGADRGYILNGESCMEWADFETAHITRKRVSSVQKTSISAPESKSYPTSNGPPASPDGRYDSSSNSPSVAPKTLQHIQALPLTSKEQASISRLPSETQYDADTERSDGSEAQKEPMNIMDVEPQHQGERKESDILDDSEFGAALVRCKTPDLVQSGTQGTVRRPSLKKSSPSESEEVTSSIYAGSEAVMQFVGDEEKRLMSIETPFAADILRTEEEQEYFTCIDLSPKLQCVQPSFEGMENVDWINSRAPTKHENTTSLADAHDRSGRVCSKMSAKSVSPLHLTATVSSTSPPHPPWHLRISHGTDEDVETARLNRDSSSVRELAEESPQHPHRKQSATAPPGTPSPADYPLPMSVLPARADMHSFLDGAEDSKASVWSPFNEPRFADVAYSMLENSPQKMAERMLTEGISRNFWKDLGLADATAPPKDSDPYTENDSLDLFVAIADRAKPSSSSDRGNIGGGRPLDYNDGRIIDHEALETIDGPVSPLSLRLRSRGRPTSRNERGLLQSVNSSELSIFTSRRSSLGRPAQCVKSRQPSRHEPAINRRPAPEIGQLARLEITSQQVEPWLHSPHELASEAPFLRAQQSMRTSSFGKKEEASEKSAETEHYPIGTNSQSISVVVQPTHSKIQSLNPAVPSFVMPARKQSSDESEETNESMSSTMLSTTTSTSALNRSHSADSECGVSVKYEHPPTA